MANIPILKPNSNAGVIIHDDSDIKGNGSHNKFCIKVVSFVLQAATKPIDITAEGDVCLDIRHTEVLHGSLRLIGYMPAAPLFDVNHDNIRSRANNKQLVMKLFIGSDQAGSPTLRYYNFKVMVQSIQTTYARTAPGIQVVMDCLITDKFDSNDVIAKTTS